MIKVPKQIAMYPQRVDNLDYLLLWIPESEYYNATGQNAQKTGDLKGFYPQGLELQFNEESLREHGIEIVSNNRIEPLSDAYRELYNAGLLEKTNIVALHRLEKYLREKENDATIQNIVEKYSKDQISIKEVRQKAALKQVIIPPAFEGDEAPEEAYKRISASQE